MPSIQYELYVLIIIVVTVTTIVNSSKKLNENRIAQLLQKAVKLHPQAKFKRCTDSVKRPNVNIKCQHNDNLEYEKCPAGHPDVAEAWMQYCLANTLINHGYQIPAYVIAGPFPKRHERVRTMLEAAKFEHVTFRSDFVIGQINQTDMDRFIFNTKSKAEGATEAELKLCADAIDASINNRPRAEHECNETGYKLNDREISLTMKHVAVHKDLYDCNASSIVNQTCYTNATSPDFRFALMIEDDQYLPVTVQRQLIELILQAPDHVGIFMLDDSYSGTPGHSPPGNIAHFNSPYTNSWSKGRSRTCGAYLLSETAIHKMFDGGHWIPQRRVIDHSFNYIIRKESIETHWVYPPISCHGSRSLEVHPHGRRDCYQCCEQFYNVQTMQPNLRSMAVVDASNKPLKVF